MDIYDREHLTEFLVALFGKQANSLSLIHI